MRNFLYLLSGIGFGIILYKSEVISWYRIQEMFRFDAFHMYGVLMSAIAVAALSVGVMKHVLAGDAGGRTMTVVRRPYQHGVVIGGLLFGMGWALTGACPGPLWVHVGAGTETMLIAIASALAGVATYAALDTKLPH